MSDHFETSKSFENQWRVNPSMRERLIDALRKAYPDRQLLNIHWSHQLNDKQGVDAWLEFNDCTMLSVDFKFRNHRNTDSWVTIETIGDIARHKVGWAGKVTPCNEVLFIQSHVNSMISDVLRVDAEALRELVCTRGDDLRAVGEVKRSSSTGKYGTWQGEFVVLTPDSLVKLLPNLANHVQILNSFVARGCAS
jgi:hypothetical protein